MARVTIYTVAPQLPKRLERLREIALNCYWIWNHEAIQLFFRMDRALWDASNQNPAMLLGKISQERLNELALDDSFIDHMDRVYAKFTAYMERDPWKNKKTSEVDEFNVAYFSAEFGVHESISIYSGGLGVLAGDHLKSASDLGFPLVGVGLLYREGYHRQYLSADGWQQERYPRNDFYNMCFSPELDDQGNQHIVEVPYPDRKVKVRIWRCQVGRVPLLLLDTDFADNDADDREITARLYGGDREMRIRQEIMLGMGGVRALHACGFHPSIYHMNEGHAAFMALERMQDLIKEKGLTIDGALEAVKSASVFTSHTPVPAGNDMFAPEMIDRYFKRWCEETGMPMDRLLGLGRQNPTDTREPFCMTVLALRLSTMANGVSRLHGEVSRSMWARTWPGVPEQEVPITSITNGVHIQSYVSRDMASLYERYLGEDWFTEPHDPEVWKRIYDIPDAELWRTHERRRERLVNFVRRRLAHQLQARGASHAEVLAASEVLDPEVLTIGFARRFATYKRADLFMRDIERLKRILLNDKRKVQIIVAGKAHPQDNQGKELIRRIVQFAREPEIRNHLVFVEDYDINVARYMVQGVDCWLNTPRRPMEASGTSGMKAAANGALNISVLDGWWCEAVELGEVGWSIGHGESYANPDEQDQIESLALYDLLEKEIVPKFYERGRDGLPRGWVERMKSCIAKVCPVFNTHRMVSDYLNRFYRPSSKRAIDLRADKRARSLALADWKAVVRGTWQEVHFTDVGCGGTDGLLFGSALSVYAVLSLGKLTEKDVIVEVYYGDVDAHGRIQNGKSTQMLPSGKVDGGSFRFTGEVPCDKTGEQGFQIRVIPSHLDLAQKHETALITWA
jgi:starch phosphorylase